MDTKQFSIPEAIFREFGVRNCECLRNTVNSFARNKLLKVEKYAGLDNDQIRIRDDQLPSLHNAVLLHAFFGNTKVVKQIFDDLAVRREKAKILEAMLFERNSVIGIALEHRDAYALRDALLGDFPLRRTRLPNPFTTLPQQMFGPSNRLLLALLAQAGTLSKGDSLLLAYLQGNLEIARSMVLAIADFPEDLHPLRQRVLGDFTEAQEFDVLLDSWRKSE